MKKSLIVRILAAAMVMGSAASTAYAVTWSANLNSALKDAKAKNKPVMVDFYTDWCGWCSKLDRDTYADPEVSDLSKKFICVRVNGDKYPALVSKYGISGYPTIFFLAPDGRTAASIVGYVNAPGMVAKMNQVLAGLAAAQESKEAKEDTGKSEKPQEKADVNWKGKVNDWWGGIKKTEGTEAAGETAQAAEAPKPTAEQAGLASFCDLLILNSGRKIQGTVESENDQYYNLRMPLGKVSIKKSDVKEIRKLLPEEACVAMGDKYYEVKDYDKAIEQYTYALAINPEYKPAKVSLETVRKKKYEEIERKKSEKKAEAEAEEAGEVKQEETAPAEVEEQPQVKRVYFNLNIMNRESIKRKYEYKDFGFAVDDNLVVNGFVAKDCNSCRPVFPAQDAGLRAGDRIVSINGESTAGLNAAEATRLIGSHRYTKFVIERP